jgi:hypothetical protein
MEQAKFPIDGLSFNYSGVLLDGLSFEQASDSDRLKTSVAISMTMNPKLEFILIRNGEKFDQSNIKVIAEMAEKNGYLVLMERIGNGDEGAIIIEDGMVENETP